jgi:hypothetical protein
VIRPSISLTFSLFLVAAYCICSSDAGNGSNASKASDAGNLTKANTNKANTASNARLQDQARALQNTKLQDAHRSVAASNQAALKRTGEIDRRLAHQHRQLHHQVDGMWDAAIRDGHQQKQQLSQRAEAQKQRIMQQHQQDTAQRMAAAKKAADSVNQSAVGLKSQTSRDGRFGLKPQTSNLHVRHYGSN